MSPSGTNELLNAIAPLLRVRPVIEDFCRFGGGWESPHAPCGRGWAQFHIVTRGSCILKRPALADIQLNSGDILLLPHGDSHTVGSRKRGEPTRIESTQVNGIRMRNSVGENPDTELLCGRLYFEEWHDNPLLSTLPDEIVIRTTGEPVLDRFRRLLFDMREELGDGRAGAEAIAADLARVMFVMMLRDHLSAKPDEEGVHSLLLERGTARVVMALLSDIARDWTLDEMAQTAVMSRASLVRAFRKHGGSAPMTFLADLRLAIARQRLAGTNQAISQIAAEVGYGSEGALSKAIMRKFGVRPGALRITATQSLGDNGPMSDSGLGSG